MEYRLILGQGAPISPGSSLQGDSTRFDSGDFQFAVGYRKWNLATFIFRKSGLRFSLQQIPSRTFLNWPMCQRMVASAEQSSSCWRTLAIDDLGAIGCRP